MIQTIYKPSPQSLWLKLLLYGPPGVGKTTLAASAQAVDEMKDVLFINIEGGTLALVKPEIYGSDEIPDTIDLNHFSTLGEVFTYLTTENHPYKTLVIDSVSELQRYNLDAITKSRGRQDDKVFLEDYGTSSKQMRRAIRAFRDLPMHVILTCHDMIVSGEGNSAETGPALSPATRSSIEGLVDVTGYMFTKAEEKDNKEVMTRVLFTAPHPRFRAKDRTPGQSLGGVIENPTMKMIMEKFRGKENAKAKQSTK